MSGAQAYKFLRSVGYGKIRAMCLTVGVLLLGAPIIVMEGPHNSVVRISRAARPGVAKDSVE